MKSDGKAAEILIAGFVTPPEINNYQEDEDFRALMAIYESSSFSILDEMNTEDFYNVYNTLKSDIFNMDATLNTIFIDKYLDEMVDVYEYEFSSKPIYDTNVGIREMYKFIEFVEYDNITFLKYVWKYLDDILEVNIRDYTFKHSDEIVEEITTQANLLVTLTENVSEFLRTYNKDSLLEWFIDRSERIKYEIYVENLTYEGENL
jgi:hypothetical protein